MKLNGTKVCNFYLTLTSGEYNRCFLPFCNTPKIGANKNFSNKKVWYINKCQGVSSYQKGETIIHLYNYMFVIKCKQ